MTAEDVKFSFERYRGTSHDLMQERMASVEALEPRRVRFTLKKPDGFSDLLRERHRRRLDRTQEVRRAGRY